MSLIFHFQQRVSTVFKYLDRNNHSLVKVKSSLEVIVRDLRDSNFAPQCFHISKNVAQAEVKALTVAEKPFLSHLYEVKGRLMVNAPLLL